MISFEYAGDLVLLKNAAVLANDLMQQAAFYDAIAAKKQFDHTRANGSQIAASLKACDRVLNIQTFTKRHSKTLGYTSPGKPDVLFLNIADDHLKRSAASLAGTFVHEAVHACDRYDTTLRFGHKGNRAKGNKSSAPYWIGNLAVEMIRTQDRLPDAAPAMMATENKALLFEPLAVDATDVAEIANFFLTVTVRDGALPPVDIKVTLDGPGFHQFYTKPQSFSKQEVLQPGAYDLNVAGSNPFEGETTVEISGNFEDGPGFRKETSKLKDYSLDFSFIISKNLPL